jgi:Ca2+/Na+ antiporter
MPETEAKPKTLDEIFRNYAWGYFALHADHRLKAFQFFITLSTAIVGGFLLLFRYGQSHKWMAVLGFLLAFLAFVFWKLDIRTRTLVKNSEEALRFLDSQHNFPDVEGAPHPLRMFSRDDHFTTLAARFPIVSGHFSYTRCFKYVFVVFGIIGIGAGIACLIYLPV